MDTKMTTKPKEADWFITIDLLTTKFADRVTDDINIVLKNIPKFSDFDLCGLRSMAKKLVCEIGIEEDKRDEAEGLNPGS